MIKRVAWLAVVAIVMFGAVFAGNIAYGEVNAQDEGTWQIAGGDRGFALENWDSADPDESLAAWIESMPDDCDIQLIDRGVSFKSAMYRCPGD